MYVRLLAESLRRGTRRKLLAVTAVALGTLGATALAEVVLASGDRLAAEMGSYGANLQLAPKEGQTLPEPSLARVRKIFWRNNVIALAPLYSLRVRTGDRVAPLVGTWFDHELEPGWRTGLPRTRPTLRIEGRWPREGAPEAVVGRRLARRLGASPGDTIEARLGDRAEKLTIVGVLTSGGQEEEEAFTPLAIVQSLSGQTGFTRAEVFALTTPEGRNARDPRRMTAEEYEAWYCTAYPSAIAFQIGEAVPQGRASIV